MSDRRSSARLRPDYDRARGETRRREGGYGHVSRRTLSDAEEREAARIALDSARDRQWFQQRENELKLQGLSDQIQRDRDWHALNVLLGYAMPSVSIAIIGALLIDGQDLYAATLAGSTTGIGLGLRFLLQRLAR